MKLIFFFGLFLFSMVQAEEPTAPASSNSNVQMSSDGKSGLRTKKIKHPGAKDGLYLIDEEGQYHYKVETLSKEDSSLYFRFISQEAPNITTEVNNETLTFEDFYGSGPLMGIEAIYEWQPWKNLHNLGAQLGFGLLVSSGEGRFRQIAGRTPKESFSLLSVPMTLGMMYRFRFSKKQWVVPYVAGGLLYNGFLEYRDDGDMKLVGSPAGYGGGGLLVNLTSMNKRLAFTMDREYGFSHLWILAEFRAIQSFNQDLDVSTNQISLGLGADY